MTAREQAEDLARMIGGKKHVIISGESTIDGVDWIQVAIRIPVGTPRTLREFCGVMRMLGWAIWKEMKPWWA